MPNLRPVPISENPGSSWQNLIQKTIQAQNVIAGSGLRTSFNGGDFTQLSLNNDVDFDHLVWRGDYDTTLEYNINDVVRVLPNKAYTDPNKGTLPIGATSEDGHPFIPLSMGLFVCVAHVPPSWATPTYFFTTVQPSFPDVTPYNWQQGIRWFEHNAYYPVFPEIPTSLTQSVDTGAGFTITANNTFWQALPFGTMPMRVCTDGVAKTFYIVGAESGSAFKTEYLPYTG